MYVAKFKEDDGGVACFDAISILGIDASVLIKLLPTIENDIEELADALRIDVIQSNVYALVAKSIQEKLEAPVSS